VSEHGKKQQQTKTTKHTIEFSNNRLSPCFRPHEFPSALRAESRRPDCWERPAEQVYSRGIVGLSGLAGRADLR
ncbi:hypothetical protein, partial [Mycolicibacterium brumae]|uniref:hypothetical protein n=1 Tax=Mycolicibacterium brumae TaxID=85968 RepID=UPI001F30ECFA